MKKLYFLILAICFSSTVLGQVIVSDDFDYPDGSLVGATGSTWVNHSGTAGDLLVSSGQARVAHGTPSEDANIPFAAVSGTIYYGIDFTVEDPGSAIAGSDFEYFAHFKDDGFNFAARLDIVPPTASGDFSVGIASDDSTADATWATDLSYGVKYRAIVEYDQDSNIAKLWIDPTSEASTSITGDDGDDPGDTIVQFALRQSDSDTNESILVDNLVVGNLFSDVLSFPLSLKKNKIPNFSVYPNPTQQNFVTISSKWNTAIDIEVYDIIGKQILNKKITDHILDISTLKSGMYLVRAEQDNAISIEKLVVR